MLMALVARHECRGWERRSVVNDAAGKLERALGIIYGTLTQGMVATATKPWAMEFNAFGVDP